MNWAEKVKKREQKILAELLEIMEVKESQVNTLKYEVAYEYLEKIFGTDAYGMEHIPNTSEFWTWWRMEWAKIDSIFIHAIDWNIPEGSKVLCTIRHRDNTEKHCIINNIQQLRHYYRLYHEASMQNRYINSTAVSAGMHKMMDAVINKKRNPVNHG